MSFIRYVSFFYLASYFPYGVFMASMLFLAPLIPIFKGNKDIRAGGIALAILLGLISIIFSLYFLGFWSSFCYFVYRAHCQKFHVSATWLYWIIAFVAAVFPLRFFASDKEDGSGGCFLSLIIPLFFILPSFYPAPVLYLYQWALEPVINFLF